MKTLTKQTLEEKIEKILFENCMASPQEQCFTEKNIIQLYSLFLDSFDELVGEKKTNEDYMKQLNVPSSDYSWGHSYGFNQAIDELRAKIQELREGEKMKNYKEKIEKILGYYESDGSNITYKKTEADLFSLMLNFAEEIVGEDEFYEPGFSTNNKLRRNQRQRIEEMRKKV